MGKSKTLKALEELWALHYLLDSYIEALRKIFLLLNVQVFLGIRYPTIMDELGLKLPEDLRKKLENLIEELDYHKERVLDILGKIERELNSYSEEVVKSLCNQK